MNNNDEKLNTVVFFIEGTPFERHSLWKQHEKNWVEDSMGFMVNVGYIDDNINRPVNVAFTFVMFYGKRICFYETVSRYDDSIMVIEYLQNEYPDLAKQPVRMTNSENFHHVIHYCQDSILPEKYYYGTTGWNNQDCTERCMVKDTGIMIGSAACQDCEFMVEVEKTNVNETPTWIKCSRIKEATKK